MQIGEKISDEFSAEPRILRTPALVLYVIVIDSLSP